MIAIDLYHKFVSKKLIDIISQNGHCMSCTEIRKFTTSAAIHVSSLQTPTPVGAHLPPDAVHRDKGGGFIIAAAANWDHNERTIDDKRTTHVTGNFCNSAHPSKHPMGVYWDFCSFVTTVEITTLFSFPSKTQINAQGTVTENPGMTEYPDVASECSDGDCQNSQRVQ